MVAETAGTAAGVTVNSTSPAAGNATASAGNTVYVPRWEASVAVTVPPWLVVFFTRNVSGGAAGDPHATSPFVPK